MFFKKEKFLMPSLIKIYLLFQNNSFYLMVNGVMNSNCSNKVIFDNQIFLVVF